MTFNFDEIVHPSPERQIKSYKIALNYCETHVGDCGTCIHCQADLEKPGVCTDYGICLAGSPLFSEKVCGLIHDDCPFYEENVEALNNLKNKIKELEEQL